MRGVLQRRPPAGSPGFATYTRPVRALASGRAPSTRTPLGTSDPQPSARYARSHDSGDRVRVPAAWHPGFLEPARLLLLAPVAALEGPRPFALRPASARRVLGARGRRGHTVIPAHRGVQYRLRFTGSWARRPRPLPHVLQRCRAGESLSLLGGVIESAALPAHVQASTASWSPPGPCPGGGAPPCA